jgi:hypothetical protein
MNRKPLTREQALARWHRESANIQRVIDEGKARHSMAARIFPHLSNGRTVEIARRDTVRPQQTAPNSIASALYPRLRAENK